MDWGTFLYGPEEEAVGFAFFETELFQGFAEPDDCAGRGDDVYMGSFGDEIEDLCCGKETGGFRQWNLLEVGKKQLFLNGVYLKLFIGFGDGANLLFIKVEFETLLEKVIGLGVNHSQVDGMLIIDGKDFKTQKPAGAG